MKYIGAESYADGLMEVGCSVNGRWLSPDVILSIAADKMEKRELSPMKKNKNSPATPAGR